MRNGQCLQYISEMTSYNIHVCLKAYSMIQYCIYIYMISIRKSVLPSAINTYALRLCPSFSLVLATTLNVVRFIPFPYRIDTALRLALEVTHN